MSKDYCIKEAEMAVLTTKVDEVMTIIKGNGKPGIQTQMIELNTNMEIRTKTDEKIATALSGLLKFQTETETTGKNKDKRMALFFVIAGLIFTGINLFIK